MTENELRLVYEARDALNEALREASLETREVQSESRVYVHKEFTGRTIVRFTREQMGALRLFGLMSDPPPLQPCVKGHNAGLGGRLVREPLVHDEVRCYVIDVCRASASWFFGESCKA